MIPPKPSEPALYCPEHGPRPHCTRKCCDLPFCGLTLVPDPAYE